MRRLFFAATVLFGCRSTPPAPEAETDREPSPARSEGPRTDGLASATTEAKEPSPAAAKPITRRRTPPDGECPPGMLVVAAGELTDRQAKQLATISKGEAEGGIDRFCLQKVPTTLRTNEACVRDGWCQVSKTFSLPCVEDGKDVAGGECDPAGGPYFMGYYDIPFEHTADVAKAYCELQGWRLPTMAEWLWAAGGGDEDRKYPWGDQAPSGKRLNAADPMTSSLTCDSPDVKCPKGKEETAFALLREEDGYAEVAPVGSYPAGAGRWGHLDLVGNQAQLVRAGDGFALCGGDNGTYRRREIALHEKPCQPCTAEVECKGAIRCVADPVDAGPR